jgi:hypothetical protein
LDHNPFLEQQARAVSQEPAKGEIEPRSPSNLVWQTRSAPPTEYESRLADALEQVFEEGHETLDGVVARLNAMGMQTPDGKDWDEASFQAIIKRLGS